MTKPIKASERGLKPHYKVRIVLPGAILHLASWAEPTLHHTWKRGAVTVSSADGPVHVEADWIDDPAYGDTIGFVDWSEASAVTWRFSA